MQFLVKSISSRSASLSSCFSLIAGALLAAPLLPNRARTLPTPCRPAPPPTTDLLLQNLLDRRRGVNRPTEEKKKGFCEEDKKGSDWVRAIVGWDALLMLCKARWEGHSDSCLGRRSGWQLGEESG